MLCVCCLQVAQRAGEIAKELGLISQAEQGDAGQANNTGGNWINLNLFSRNGSDASNSSWYSADGSQEQSAVEAALEKYQQMDKTDENVPEAEPSPDDSSIPVFSLADQNRLNTRPGNASDVERTRPQTRAERAGTKPSA